MHLWGALVQLLNVTIANSGDVQGVVDIMVQRSVQKALVAAVLEQLLKKNLGLGTNNGFPLRFGDHCDALYRDARDLVQGVAKGKSALSSCLAVICKHVQGARQHVQNTTAERKGYITSVMLVMAVKTKPGLTKHMLDHSTGNLNDKVQSHGLP